MTVRENPEGVPSLMIVVYALVGPVDTIPTATWIVTLNVLVLPMIMNADVLKVALV